MGSNHTLYSALATISPAEQASPGFILRVAPDVLASYQPDRDDSPTTFCSIPLVEDTDLPTGTAIGCLPTLI